MAADHDPGSPIGSPPAIPTDISTRKVIAARPSDENTTALSRRVEKYASESSSLNVVINARISVSSGSAIRPLSRCERNSTRAAANNASAPNRPSRPLIGLND